VDHLFRGEKGDTEQLQAQAAAYGVILEQHHVEPEHYQLWPEHAEVVDLFLRCMTQWRPTSNGVIGLDYGVVLQLASLYKISDPAVVLEDLQVMELHARAQINKQLEKR
jgi:hypothetical protein